MIPFSPIEGDQLRQVAHHLPRLVGIGVDELDRNQPADRRAGRRRQRVDVVLVVAHGHALR